MQIVYGVLIQLLKLAQVNSERSNLLVKVSAECIP